MISVGLDGGERTLQPRAHLNYKFTLGISSDEKVILDLDDTLCARMLESIELLMNVSHSFINPS